MSSFSIQQIFHVRNIRRLLLTNQISISSNMLRSVWDVLLSLTQKQKETAFIYHHVSLRWLSEGRIGSVTHFGLHGSDFISCKQTM